MPDPQYNNKYDKQFAENKNISDETKMMYDHFVNTSTSGVFYMPEGITFDEFREETGYNPMSGMDFNQRLSDSQGAVEQFTKGVGGLVLRLPGSAIRSVGSLFELDALYDDDIKSIGNWATELGDAMVEGADDLAGKIYTEKPGSFNPSDFGWWMEGTRSMSDTVALMGLGYLTGGLGFATAGLLGAGEAAAGFVGGVTAAMASRMSEGLGNSAQTKKETYDRMIALGADESIAKQEALKAAQNHFIATSPLIAIDFFQFSKAFNVAGKTGAKALAGAGKEAAEQATKSSLMKGVSYVPKAIGKLRNTKVGGYLDNAVGEAVEEGWQEATGVYIGDQTIQGSFDGLDIRGFWDKTKDAMSDDRTLTAALQGAVGGIMMESSSPLVRNVSDFYKAKSTGMTMDQVKDAREKIATVNYLKNVLANDKKRNEAQAGSDIDHQNKQEAISRARLFQSMIDRYERDGNFDGFNKELDAYLAMAEDSEAGQKLRDDATKISKKNNYSSLTGQYDSVKQMKEEAVEIQKKIEESKKENSKPENSHIDQVSMNAAIAEDHLREWLANKDFETLNKKKAETTNAVDAVVDAMGLDSVQSDLLKAEIIAEINHDGDSKYTPMLDDIYNGDNFKKLKEQLKEHYEDISKLKSRHQTSKFRSASVKALMTDLKTVSGSFNKLLDDAAFILGTKDSKGKKSKDASYDPQDIETLHERISAFNGSIIKSKLSKSQQKALGNLIDSILDTENLINKRRKFLKKNSELEARYRGEYMELLLNDTFKILTLLADIESEIDKAESEKEKNKLLKKKKLLEDDLKKISEVYKNLESLQTQEDKDKTRIQNELRNNEGTSTPSEVSNDAPVSEEPSTSTDEEYEDTIDEDPLGVDTFTFISDEELSEVDKIKKKIKSLEDNMGKSLLFPLLFEGEYSQSELDDIKRKNKEDQEKQDAEDRIKIEELKKRLRELEQQQQQSDLPLGKVGNTKYEVRADGVYFDGVKINNPDNKPYKQLIEEDIKRREQNEIDSEANGLQTARKGDKGVFWTQFKGAREDNELDEDVEVEYVSKHGVKFVGKKDWTNFSSYFYFRNITKEQQIKAKYQKELAELNSITTTQPEVVAGVEDKKADIQKRRQEILNNYKNKIKKENPEFSENTVKAKVYEIEKFLDAVENDVFLISDVKEIVKELYGTKLNITDSGTLLFGLLDKDIRLGSNIKKSEFKRALLSSQFTLDYKEKGKIGLGDRLTEEQVTEIYNKIKAKYDAKLAELNSIAPQQTEAVVGVEDKKADIERRRQEDVKQLGTKVLYNGSEGKFVEVKEGNSIQIEDIEGKDEILIYIKQRNGVRLGRAIRESNGLWSWRISPLGGSGFSDSELFDALFHHKIRKAEVVAERDYDAELAALEQQSTPTEDLSMEGSVLIGVNSFKLKIKLDNVINEFFSKIKSRKQKNSSLRKADVKVDIYKNDDGGYEMLIYQGEKSITVDIPLDANGLSESDVDALLKTYGSNITATLIADADGNVNSISINKVKVPRVRKKKGSKVSAPVAGEQLDFDKKKEIDYSEENNERVTDLYNRLEDEYANLSTDLERLDRQKEDEERNQEYTRYDEAFDKAVALVNKAIEENPDLFSAIRKKKSGDVVYVGERFLRGLLDGLLNEYIDNEWITEAESTYISDEIYDALSSDEMTKKNGSIDGRRKLNISSKDNSELGRINYEIEQTRILINRNRTDFNEIKKEYDLLNPYQDKEEVRQPYQDLANYIYRAEARGEGPVYGKAKIFGVRYSAQKFNDKGELEGGNPIFQFVVNVNGVDYFGSSMNIDLLGKEGEGSVLSKNIKDQMDNLTENEVVLDVQPFKYNKAYPAVDLTNDSWWREGVPVLTDKVTTYNIVVVNKDPENNTLFTHDKYRKKFLAKLLNDDIYYERDVLINEIKTVSLIDQSKEAYEKRLNEEHEREVNKQNEAKKQEGAKPFDEEKLKDILNSNEAIAKIFEEIKAQNNEELTNKAANLIINSKSKTIGITTSIALNNILRDSKMIKEGKLDNNVSSETFSQEGDTNSTVTNEVDKVLDLFNQIEELATTEETIKFAVRAKQIKDNDKLPIETKESVLEKVLKELKCRLNP